MTQEQLKGANDALSYIGIENVQDIIIIDNGATNKSVFEGVFGYEPATDAVVCNKEDWCGASKPCNYCMANPNNIGREENWWNATYNAESEAEKNEIHSDIR